MAVSDIVPVPGARFEETLASASPDLLREMIKGFAQRMMDAEVEERVRGGVRGGQPGPGELPQRVPAAGLGHPGRDDRAGDPEAAAGHLLTRSGCWSGAAGRSGRWPPWWRRRYLLGVSTRRVEKLAESLGVTKLSKSQVSVMAAELDEMVASFRSRPLDAGPYTFVWIDALTQKVREGGRTVNVHALIATGVNADGKREILGLDVATAEDGAGWLAFLRGLAARGLSGVQLVTSDCHHGLRDAIAAVLPGASWQRCRTHYARNLATKVPKSAQPWVATLVRTIFEQPDAASVRAQHAQVVDRPGGQVPARRRAPRRRPRRPPGVHRVPARDLAPDLEQQPPGTPQQGDPPPHRRGRASSPTATPSSAWSARSWPSRTTNGPRPAATWAPKSSPPAGNQPPILKLNGNDVTIEAIGA